MNDAVIEFPWVEQLPKREKSRLAKLWDHFAEVRAIQREHGTIVPVKLAADLAGVTRQRIDDLVERGQLVRIYVNGHPFITENSFVEWAKTERKNGRPLKVLATNKEIWKAAHEAAKVTVKNTSK
jgi:hypothetical protein